MSADANIAAHRDVPPFRFADKIARQAARLTRKKWKDANELASELSTLLASLYVDALIAGSSSRPLVIQKVVDPTITLAIADYPLYSPCLSPPDDPVTITVAEKSIVTIIQQPYISGLFSGVAFAVEIDGESLDHSDRTVDNITWLDMPGSITGYAGIPRISMIPINPGTHTFSWVYATSDGDELLRNSSIHYIVNKHNRNSEMFFAFR